MNPSIEIHFRQWATRITIVFVIATVLLSMGCRATNVTERRTAGPPPNLIVLLADDAGYADFGFTGNAEFRTPSLDQLAREGTVLEQSYVTASVCSPSRAGLLTGRYQQRFGHEYNLPYTANVPRGLPLTERTLAAHLGHEGYQCAAFGKWHLGAHEGYHPLDRGFDHFAGFLGGSRSYFPVEEPRATHQWYVDREPVGDPPSTYVTKRIAADAERFLRSRKASPFFMYVSFTAVHTPMHAQPEDLATFDTIAKPKRRKLAAMTRALDRAVGDILRVLEETGAAKNTVVWFVNDNGGATNNGSDNGRFRGMKGSKWEGGIRVPAIVRWPGVTKPSTRLVHPVSTLDIASTALAAVADRQPLDRELDGIDLYQSFIDPQSPRHRTLYWRRGPAAAIRDGRWKLIRVETNPITLFDVSTDPEEQHNVAGRHPEVVGRLRAALDRWESELVEPLWTTGKVWRDNQIRKHRLDVIGRDAERKLP